MHVSRVARLDRRAWLLVLFVVMGSAVGLVFHVDKIIPQELFTVELFGGDLHYQVFLVLVVLCHELLVLLSSDFRGVL